MYSARAGERSQTLGLIGRRRWVDSPAAVTVVATALLLSVYVLWHPTSPDLAAQVARAGVVQAAGRVAWWTGWFGGLSLPSYSVVVPWSMAHAGVEVTGVVAVLVGSVAGSVLARDVRRPRAASLAFSFACVADLLAGRVTFAVGFAVAAWALVALRSRRGLFGCALGALSFLASPLAALFLGIVAAAVLLSDPTRRAAAGMLCVSVLVAAATMAALFPGTGTMPFNVRDSLACGVCCAALYLSCPNRLVRACALLVAATLVVLLIVPGAVGSNITRLLWLCAAPVAVGCAELDRRAVAALVTALSVWPTVDLVTQLRTADTPASSAGYYQPLLARISTDEHAATAAAVGARVEVLDTATHWASVYVADQVAIARGWDRQADVADNPIFYQPGALTSASYHAWLQQLAVGWIAVPHTRLDSASVAEAALVSSGLPYLALDWSSKDWTLYRVLGPHPLATGATITAVTAGGVTVRTAGPATVHLQIRYTRYLSVVDAAGQPVPACVRSNGSWTELTLNEPGTYTITSEFDLDGLAQNAEGCPA